MKNLQSISSLFPVVSVAVLTFVSLMPWGTSEGLRFLLPLLPLIGVHYWLVRQPQSMPVWFVFLCGLAVDALTSGPLGLWSLTYMVGLVLASQTRNLRLGPSFLARFIVFGIWMALVIALVWAVSSIYFARIFDWSAMVQALIGAALAYPVIALLFWPLNRARAPQSLGPLTRGM